MLGLSIAKYLGITIDGVGGFLGGSVVILILATSNLLSAYFSPTSLIHIMDYSTQERELFKRWLLYVSESLLAVSVIISFMFILQDGLSVSAILFLVLDLILALAISIPPIRLTDRGYGELALAILLTGFPAIIAFLIQASNLHRLVTYISFPLIFLALAYLLVLDFPAYSTDQKIGYQSLLVRLTWQRAVPFHNLLLFVAYIFFAAAPFFGIPIALVWSPILTIPLAIYEIVMLRNITIGLKPNWTIITINATALVGLNIYFLMLTFWLR